MIAAASGAACSLVLDWNGYSAASADGGDLPSGTPCGPSGSDGRCATVPLPDGGWVGPMTLYGAESTPPGCGTGYDSFYQLSSQPAACSACTCGSPSGEACAAPDATYYGDSACATSCGHQPLVSAACVMPPCGSNFTVANAEPHGGGCAPLGGAPTLPAPFSLAARACPTTSTLPSTACGTGQLCVPAPPAPSAPRICLRFEGAAAACPGFPYINGPMVLFEQPPAVTDTRGCAPCACSDPAGASCALSALGNVLRLDPKCMVPNLAPPLIALPSTCQDLGQSGGLQLNGTFRLTAGSCAPDGGAPMGAVSATGAQASFCCTTASP
ncbi:MAG TPA: hypothetical protein VH044_04585 [Polyangiaceae bacterium]|nr:hypothetical protein [Polyangiaceae bacterium]